MIKTKKRNQNLKEHFMNLTSGEIIFYIILFIVYSGVSFINYKAYFVNDNLGPVKAAIWPFTLFFFLMVMAKDWVTEAILNMNRESLLSDVKKPIPSGDESAATALKYFFT